MLLIDGLYINNGGGKTLLDLLVKKVSKENVDVMYLFDKRILHEYKHLNLKNATFISASILQRHIFYLKNRSKITSVLAFANIPPTVKLNCKVYTYFHNILFILNSKSANRFNVLSIWLKSSFIKFIKRNTTIWVVQSNYVKKELQREWKIKSNDILVLPIYYNELKVVSKNKLALNHNAIKFIYVSDGHYYKNHKKLINAFSKYNKLYPKSSLTLTISQDYKEIKAEAIINSSMIAIGG